MKTIEEINQRNVKKILSEKKIPDFFTGDVVKVGVRITEGKKERIQYFEGICIAKKNRDLNSSFTVRKIELLNIKMKTIEEINQRNVKKFFQKKKSLIFLLVML